MGNRDAMPTLGVGNPVTPEYHMGCTHTLLVLYAVLCEGLGKPPKVI